MGILLDVVKVQPRPGHVLLLEFENGERRRFDMAAYMDQKPWQRLKDSPLFFRASVEYGTVVWPGDIDIDPETLYERSEAIEAPGVGGMADETGIPSVPPRAAGTP